MIVSQEHHRLPSHRAVAKRLPRIVRDAEDRACELMTMAAHDLRSPLAAIRMNAYALTQRWQAGEEPTSAEWATAVIGIRRATDEAFIMIEDLLALERLHPRAESATARLTTDVRSVIDEAIASQKEALQRAHCKVTVVYREGLDRTQGHWDRGYLLRLFANLLQNAVRHAPGAPVQIALARRGNRLGIVFADRGPGLTPAVADLGRDQRNDGAELDTHGLGLWIVRRAVQRLGGRLSIHNRPGHGVAFDLELPGLAL